MDTMRNGFGEKCWAVVFFFFCWICTKVAQSVSASQWVFTACDHTRFQACVLAGNLQAIVGELSGHYGSMDISGSQGLP